MSSITLRVTHVFTFNIFLVTLEVITYTIVRHPTHTEYYCSCDINSAFQIQQKELNSVRNNSKWRQILSKKVEKSHHVKNAFLSKGTNAYFYQWNTPQNDLKSIIFKSDLNIETLCCLILSQLLAFSSPWFLTL